MHVVIQPVVTPLLDAKSMPFSYLVVCTSFGNVPAVRCFEDFKFNVFVYLKFQVKVKRCHLSIVNCVFSVSSQL